MLREASAAGIPDNLITLIPPFTPDDGVSSALGPHTERIVFAGRLSPVKGVRYLLAALKDVQKAVPGVGLDIIGDGESRGSLEVTTKSLNLEGCVIFHGWLDHKSTDRLMRNAAIVAFPSVYPEAFGLVGIEAMIRGRPVVGFDVGGVKDWLCDGVTGFVVKPKDTVALAESMVRLLRDRNLNQQFGSAARRIALEKFSPQPHLDRLTGIYKDAIHRHRW